MKEREREKKIERSGEKESVRVRKIEIVRVGERESERESKRERKRERVG